MNPVLGKAMVPSFVRGFLPERMNGKDLLKVVEFFLYHVLCVIRYVTALRLD